MESTESKPEITDIEDPSTSSLFQFEMSETGEPIPFELLNVKDGGKESFVKSMQPYINTEISPQNVNIGNDSNQSTTCTYNEEISNRPAKRIRTNSRDDDDYLSNTSDSEDEEQDYFHSSHDSSGDASSSDEELHNNDSGFLFGRLSPSAADSEAFKIRLKLKKPRNLLVSPPATPYEAFRLFLSDDLLDTIVRETNEFVRREPNVAKNVRRPPTLSSWKDLTREELLTFLGLLLHTGTMRMNFLEDYWMSGHLFNLTAFSNFMSRNRFLRIYQCLSFTQKETVNSRDDIFANFRLIIDNFNTTMKEIYYPGKQLILAKSTVSVPIQIVPKMITRKVNFLMLSDSNGVVTKYQVNTGNTSKDRVKKDQQILDLTEDLLQGHVIYMDKNFSSYKLATELLHRQTYCTARLSKLERQKLSPEDSRSLNIAVIKQCSRKRKYFMSTECGSEIVYSPYHKGEFQAVINYRKFMYGTSKELLRTLSSHQPCYRNTLRSHQRLFVQALQISLNNAFQLFNFYGTGDLFNFSEFRMSVLNSLLPAMRPRENAGHARRHRLTNITKTRSRLKQDPNGARQVVEVCRRLCARCRRSVRYECTVCAACPALCPPCYSLTHKYYD